MKITYVIQLPSPMQLPESAKLRIEIRDTSLADARSITLASKALDSAAISGHTTVEGEIETDSGIAQGRQTTLWAHLSMKGERKIEREDYIVTQAYPLIDGMKVVVRLNRVAL
jgi:putative lipoprotein